MRETKLLPCPFCGGEATLRKSAFFTCKVFVKCKKCGARTLEYSSASMEDAEMNANNSWNTRKPMDRIVEQLEELEVKHSYNPIKDEIIYKGIDIEDVLNIVKRGGKDASE